MNFYCLVIEEFSGHKYPILSTFCFSADDIQKQLDKWRTDLYKNVEIKTVQVSEEQLLKWLIHFNEDVQRMIMGA